MKVLMEQNTINKKSNDEDSQFTYAKKVISEWPEWKLEIAKNIYQVDFSSLAKK